MMKIVVSFNPCFTGSLTVTQKQNIICIVLDCFNPCFTGSLTVTKKILAKYMDILLVSILVLLEVLL